MSDLERDLRDLLETKAGDVQTTPLAPPAVLRRGRRRQVGNVVGGALMAAAAAALVVGGAATFLGDRASEPPIMGDPGALPARTAVIGGVTVTAPQGWSLLDQSLWSMAIATETCTSSFEGTATPVGPGASEGDADPVETPPTVEEECTPVDLAAGVPIFTLANVEPNPTQTVCEVIPELPAQSVGRTDAYLYVAIDPDPQTQETWPVPLETVLPGSCGTNLTAEWIVDGVGYFAAAAFGPEVSDADRQAVLDAFAGLGFEGSPPQMAASPVIGFVVAAGVQDGVAWRLEAGPSLTCQSLGACVVQLAVITTDAGGDEQASPVTPPTTGSSITSASQPIGQATIAFGAAAADVEAVEIVAGDGATVTPTSVPWPSTLEAFASPEAPVDGTIWWATVPDVDTVNAVLADGSTGPRDTPAAPYG